MSMNLHLVAGKKTFSLRQTPTYISYMCMTPRTDSTANIAERYILWVESTLNGAWSDVRHYESCRDEVTEHVNELRTWLKKHPDAKFTVS